jgi:hypothetical protein
MTEPNPTPDEGVSPSPDSGLSPAPEPGTPTSDPDRPGSSSVPESTVPSTSGTAPASGRKGCLGAAAAAVVALAGVAGGVTYAVVRIWSSLGA